jgi:bacteriocin biosynthesis cyclodehydratase domain-containing protein
MDKLAPWIEASRNDHMIVFQHGHRFVVYLGRGAADTIETVLAVIQQSEGFEAALSNFSKESQPAVKAIVRKLRGYGILQDFSQRNTSLAMAAKEIVGGEMSCEDIATKEHEMKLVVISNGTVPDVARLLAQENGLHNIRWIENVAEDQIPDILDGEDKGSLILYSPTAHNDSLGAAINRWALSRERAWMQILPYNGGEAVIGPLFIPRQTACYECFRLRRRAASAHGKEQRVMDDGDAIAFANQGTGSWNSPAQSGIIWSMFFQLLSIEMLDLHALPMTPLRGQAHTVSFDESSVAVDHHRVFTVPRCPACRAPSLPLPQPWIANKPSPEPNGEVMGNEAKGSELKSNESKSSELGDAQ